MLALSVHLGAMYLLEAFGHGTLQKRSQRTAKAVWMQGMPLMSITSAGYRQSKPVVWILLAFDSPCLPSSSLLIA